MSVILGLCAALGAERRARANCKNNELKMDVNINETRYLFTFIILQQGFDEHLANLVQLRLALLDRVVRDDALHDVGGERV